MVIPIIILVAIPIFLGIVAVSPFDQLEEFNDEMILEEPEFNDELISKEPDMNILYFLLIVIWTVILLRRLLLIKKGTFKTLFRIWKNTDGIKERNAIFIMGKRITIVLDEDLLMKLRRKQAKLIYESINHVSFSRVINEILRKCIK